jgi:hypothetical protein
MESHPLFVAFLLLMGEIKIRRRIIKIKLKKRFFSQPYIPLPRRTNDLVAARLGRYAYYARFLIRMLACVFSFISVQRYGISADSKIPAGQRHRSAWNRSVSSVDRFPGLVSAKKCNIAC